MVIVSIFIFILTSEILLQNASYSLTLSLHHLDTWFKHGLFSETTSIKQLHKEYFIFHTEKEHNKLRL